MNAVRTVLGDIPGSELGTTNYHEHLFQVSPLLPGDDLTNEQSSAAEAGLLLASGFSAMVDATPIGLGRNAAALARISARIGLRIVASTGAHRQAHYAPGHWLLELDEAALADTFIADIVAGIPATDSSPRPEPAEMSGGQAVRAGLLKGGIEYWRITPFERRVLSALARAHRATGAPMMVHLEHGSAAFEVLELLAAEGVESSSVILAHIDRNPDPVLHADLAAVGAYLGYDGFARSQRWPDAVLIDCAVRAAELGAADRLLLGGDVARATRYVSYGGMPGLGYVGNRVLPRFAAADPSLVRAATIDNPARVLAAFGP